MVIMAIKSDIQSQQEHRSTSIHPTPSNELNPSEHQFFKHTPQQQK
jgi:hypothetical protein